MAEDHSNRRLQQAQQQVGEVVDIMRVNVEKVNLFSEYPDYLFTHLNNLSILPPLVYGLNIGRIFYGLL